MITLQDKVRTYDGSGNNEVNTEWGKVGNVLQRKGSARYQDGISQPIQGPNRSPNARVISNLVGAEGPNI